MTKEEKFKEEISDTMRITNIEYRMRKGGTNKDGRIG